MRVWERLVRGLVMKCYQAEIPACGIEEDVNLQSWRFVPDFEENGFQHFPQAFCYYLHMLYIIQINAQVPV